MSKGEGEEGGGGGQEGVVLTRDQELTVLVAGAQVSQERARSPRANESPDAGVAAACASRARG